MVLRWSTLRGVSFQQSELEVPIEGITLRAIKRRRVLQLAGQFKTPFFCSFSPLCEKFEFWHEALRISGQEWKV